MTSRRSEPMPSRARWLTIIGAAAVAALTVTATASSTGASGETSTSEESTTSDASTSSAPAGESTTTAAGATTTRDRTTPTASSADFTATLAAECEGDTGHPLLADAVQNVAVPDGSLRLIEILRTCDVEFVGPVDEALGRPLTNVEALIADPVNNVTPNQAQLDALNAELAIYWRIANAWAQSQAGGTAESGATTTVATGSAPASDVATSDAEESPTTGG